MKTWLVTGAGGMLGRDLVDVIGQGGDDVLGVTRHDLDVRNEAACRAAVANSDVVVNAAAWTDVDGAERHEAEAFSINAIGAANLARACAASGAVLVQISTDYVFDGTASTPYRVDMPLSPLNAYGRTKAAAEWVVRAECPSTYVVRTSWLYGAHGDSFARKVLMLATQRDTLDVVVDQRGQPTWTQDLARFVQTLVTGGEPFGIVHGTASGETTWYGLARAVFALAGLDPSRVRETTADRFPRPARRPAYSVLANDQRLPDWQDALRRAAPALLQ